MSKPGIYWNGESLDFGFWVLQRSGKLYFSGTPVTGGHWEDGDTPIEKLHFLCSMDGKPDKIILKKPKIIPPLENQIDIEEALRQKNG